MGEFIGLLLASFSFAATAAATALAFSLLLIILRCISADSFMQSGPYRRFRAVPDMLASVCESIPLLILLVLLGQTGIQMNVAPYAEYLRKAVILGFFMFPSIWRYLDSCLNLAIEEVYPRQMILWRVPSLKVGLYYVLWKNNLAGLLSSVVWVLTAAFSLDLSIGFLRGFGLGVSYINWYEGSLGYELGNWIRSEDMGRNLVYPVITFGIIALLYYFSQKLVSSRMPEYNEIIEKRKSNQSAQFYFERMHLTPNRSEIRIEPENGLSLLDGDFVWLNGPSGSGKSLFIKAVMKLLRADDSLIQTPPEICYRDQPLSDSSVIMPQEPDLYLFPYLSAQDYLACVLRSDWEALRQLASGSQARNKDNFVSMLNVVSRIQNTQVRDLSAGEKRMLAFVVAIAQSLEQDKKLIFFDEPDSSLDENGVKALKFYLSEINHKSVIYITHNVMHSKELHEAIDKLGIWQLSPLSGKSAGYDIRRIENVEQHYQQIHQGIASSIDQISSMFRPEQKNESNRKLLLRVRFPLTVDVGAKLNLSLFRGTEKAHELKVRQGDGIIGIIGDNGIGKSSFLRAVFGFYQTSGKDIALGANSIFSRCQSTRKAVYKHRMCYIFDDIEKALPDNIPLSAVLNELSRINQRDIDATKYVSTLSDSQMKLPLSKFSGGERQKIIFDLVCHLINTDLLVLDEPFSRLDWGENLIQVAKWLKFKSTLCPVIIVSHNREIIQAVAPDSTWELKRN